MAACARESEAEKVLVLLQAYRFGRDHMDVSENSGTPKSSIFIGFSIINHPFWGTPILGNTHMGSSIIDDKPTFEELQICRQQAGLVSFNTALDACAEARIWTAA